MLVMYFGTSSGTFDRVHESLSCQSILAHVSGPKTLDELIKLTHHVCLQIVRYVSTPQGSWGQPTNDPSLSWQKWVERETENRYISLV